MTLIDRDAIHLPDDLPYKASVRRVLLQADVVDAVPVVRCKDCEWRGDSFCTMWDEEYIEWDDDGYRESERVIHDYTVDDGFCHIGQRRTE